MVIQVAKSAPGPGLVVRLTWVTPPLLRTRTRVPSAVTTAPWGASASPPV